MSAQFDGYTFDPERDHDRLTSEYGRVFRAMQDGCWWTLAELSRAAKAPEASCSARMRDMRKPRFGGHTVEREYVSAGLWQYRLIVRSVEPRQLALV